MRHWNFRCEILAAYAIVGHFHPLREPENFTRILISGPCVYRRLDRCFLREMHHLGYSTSPTCCKSHLRRVINMLADALPRPDFNALHFPLVIDHPAAFQQVDLSLRDLQALLALWNFPSFCSFSTGFCKRLTETPPTPLF